MEEKTKYKLVDQEHNTWMCQECGFMASFEADGPFENGWNVCPHCGDAILPRRKAAAMFRCGICGLVFDRPTIKEWSEPRPDCFRERFKQVLCPGCGQPYFNELEESEDADEDIDGEHEP